MFDLLLVNFGGPRHLGEIEPFLEALFCDRDVIRTRFPTFIHNWMFRRVARKRAIKIRQDYQSIGGRSPIYFDTEYLANVLQEKLKISLLTFHRYLQATHELALERIEASEAAEIRVLPLFPQFSYATTGSIARFFKRHLSPRALNKLHWIRSYPTHPAFITAFQKRIDTFLKERHLAEQETLLLFSAHGLPASFVASGDPYQTECEHSFSAIRKAFPNALTRLAYQSKFGPGEWLRPYTNEVCEQVLDWNEGRKQIVFIPLSFTSDHIETLFEIESLYLPIIRAKGLNAHRCPALNCEPYWIDALAQIAQEKATQETLRLIRPVV